jgi:hypothetical protein
MMFGYIGYIWAMLGCCTLFCVFGGSAVFLYGLGRRREQRLGQAVVTVESVGKPDAEKPESKDGA